MSQPIFKVGDKITYELCASNINKARWDFSYDNGGKDKWFVGEVIGVDERSITTTCPAGWDNGYWKWPTENNTDYEPGQWDKPGFLRHVFSSPEPTEPYNPLDRFSDLDI